MRTAKLGTEGLKRESQITAQLSSLTDRLLTLETLIGELNRTLQPVLRIEDDGEMTKDCPEEQIVDHAHSIRVSRYKVENIISTVRSISDRLEV